MSFILAYPDSGGGIPRVVEKALAAGAAFELGALLLVNASNEYAECGIDPAAIAAVAEAPAGTNTGGFSSLSKKEFPPGMMQGMAVKDMVFSARYVGALPAVDGGSYGLVRDTDSLWKVDFAETVNTRVKLVGRRTGSPENINRVLVKFLAANVQEI